MSYVSCAFYGSRLLACPYLVFSTTIWHLGNLSYFSCRALKNFRLFNGLHCGSLYLTSGCPSESIRLSGRACLHIKGNGRIKSVLLSDEGDLLSHTNGANIVVKNSPISGLAGIEIQPDSVQFGSLAADIAPSTAGFPVDNGESDLDRPTEGFSSIPEAIQDIRDGKVWLPLELIMLWIFMNNLCKLMVSLLHFILVDRIGRRWWR